MSLDDECALVEVFRAAAGRAEVGEAVRAAESAHTRHLGTHEYGLADGCARCAELAETPFETLDDANLRALCKRTQGWMRDESDAFPRSRTEQRAMRKIESLITRARIRARILTEMGIVL